jgi:mRNA interferase RelE/StbE
VARPAVIKALPLPPRRLETLRGSPVLAAVYQLNFSDQAIAELKKLPKPVQLDLMQKISEVHPEDLASGAEDMGRFFRNGKTFYRLRAGDFRLYFEVAGDILLTHYILHHHSLADFVFRFKLPFSEETLVEQHQSFWKYLESLKK